MAILHETVEVQESVGLVSLNSETGEAARNTGEAIKVRSLIWTISEEDSRRRKLVWLSAGALLALSFLLAYLAVNSVDAARGGNPLRQIDSLTQIGAGCALLGPILVSCLMAFPSRRLRRGLEELAKMSGVEEIDLLFEAQHSLTGPKTQIEIRKALTRALIHLKASDSTRLAPATLTDMSRTLGSIAETSLRLGNRHYVDYYLALIKAMEQVGDERALRAVERIAKTGGQSSARQTLGAAAQECLPALRLRVKETSESETLLRSAVNESTDELLRPAGHGGESDSALLLRPGAD